MRKHYFQIRATTYFTLLTYLLFCEHENNKTLLEVNTVSSEVFLNRKLTFRQQVLTEDLLYKMVKCTGNAIFNKKDDFYYTKIEEVFPVLMYFERKLQLSNTKFKGKLFYEIKTILNKQLTEYEHNEFSNLFLINDAFIKFFINVKRTLINLNSFVDKYYTKKIILVRYKRRKSNV